MRECVNCHNKLSPGQKTCPHCGTVQHNKHQTSLAVSVLLMLIVLVLMVAHFYNISKEQEERNKQKEQMLEEAKKEKEDKYNNSSNSNNNNNQNNNNNNNQNNNSTTNTNQNNNGYDTSKFKEINVATFKDLLNLNDNQKYLVLTASPYCSHCRSFIPKVNQSLNEYDYEVIYIDLSNIQYSDVDEISKIKGLNSFGSTPIVYIIKNGIAIDTSEGDVEYISYTKFLERNGYKKK